MTLKNTLYQSCAWLSVAAVVASLVACGGSSNSSAPDPLQPYRTQTLQWTACDGSILGQPEEATREVWQRLGERLQCSTLRVPMDWAQPERSDVLVSVMRLAAADPAQRRGALLFNPGGPGADGLEQTFSLFWAFGQSNPASAQGALQLRLLASYDMVGFSPRGTGASTRLHCATNELQRPLPLLPSGVSDENLANAAYNDRKTAEACLKNPLTPYINTDATARDMDLLRELLGEAKLNYVGYSYGTWLGGWYASLFPGNVGRMVLDSAMDYSQPLEKTFVGQALARRTLHDTLLLPYAARHPDYFQLGRSAPEIAAKLDAISPQMREALGSILSGLTYSRFSADTYLAALNAAFWVERTLATLPDPSDKYAMETAVRQQVFVAGDSQRDQVLRGQARAIYEAYHQTFFSPPQPIDLSVSKSSYWAVRCNDDVATTDLPTWNALVRSTTMAAPLHTNLENPCAYWGGPRVTKPNVAAMQGLQVLMVQSQYDGATPTAGANRFFAQLPNARRVDVPNEFQHGVFPYTDACVDTSVVRYLLGEAPTERETTCPAQPLQQDAAPAELSTMPKAAARAMAAPGPSRSPDAQPPTYLRPEEAQKLIEHFKQGIGRPR